MSEITQRMDSLNLDEELENEVEESAFYNPTFRRKTFCGRKSVGTELMTATMKARTDVGLSIAAQLKLRKKQVDLEMDRFVSTIEKQQNRQLVDNYVFDELLDISKAMQQLSVKDLKEGMVVAGLVKQIQSLLLQPLTRKTRQKVVNLLFVCGALNRLVAFYDLQNSNITSEREHVHPPAELHINLMSSPIGVTTPGRRGHQRTRSLSVPDLTVAFKKEMQMAASGTPPSPHTPSERSSFEKRQSQCQESAAFPSEFPSEHGENDAVTSNAGQSGVAGPEALSLSEMAFNMTKSSPDIFADMLQAEQQAGQQEAEREAGSAPHEGSVDDDKVSFVDDDKMGFVDDDKGKGTSLWNKLSEKFVNAKRRRKSRKFKRESLSPQPEETETVSSGNEGKRKRERGKQQDSPAVPATDPRVSESSDMPMYLLCRICEELVCVDDLEEHSRLCAAANKVVMVTHSLQVKVDKLLKALAFRVSQLEDAGLMRPAWRDELTAATLLMQGAGEHANSLEGTAHMHDAMSHLVENTCLRGPAQDIILIERRLLSILGDRLAHLREVQQTTGLNVEALSPHQKLGGDTHHQPVSIRDFTLLKPISKGAFGCVYLARKAKTGDLYAIKVLRKKDMVRRNMTEQVVAERRILTKAQFSFVAKLYYAFQSKEYLFLVMEYCIGGDCLTLLSSVGALDEPVARMYTAECLLALGFLHSNGIVHRDIKPDNLLIDHTGHIKLTDFGLSTLGVMNNTNDLFDRTPLYPGGLMDSPATFPYPHSHQPHPDEATAPLSSPCTYRGYATDEEGAEEGDEDISPLVSVQAEADFPSRKQAKRRRSSVRFSEVGGGDCESACADEPKEEKEEVVVEITEHTYRESMEECRSYSPPPPATYECEGEEDGDMAEDELSGGGVIGTPDYLAPEILLGTGFGPQADYWALGVMLFEFLTGCPPFNAPTVEEIFDNILNSNIPWPDAPQEISSDARDLITRLLKIDPNERLGARGVEEVMAHPFFAEFQGAWETVCRRDPPFVPNPPDDESTIYHSWTHLGEDGQPPDDVLLDVLGLEASSDSDQDASGSFREFTYMSFANLESLTRELYQETLLRKTEI